MSEQNETINKEMVIIKRNQIEIMELWNTIAGMRNSIEGSTAHLSRQKKELVNLKTGQSRSRKKKEWCEQRLRDL